MPSNQDGQTTCPQSQRADGAHAWHFDSDDPYIICSWCDQMQDALTGRAIKPGTGTNPSEAMTHSDVPKALPSHSDESADSLEQAQSQKDYAGDIPMGVGQWEAHGKKYGYWKYFESKLTEKRNG